VKIRYILIARVVTGSSAALLLVGVIAALELIVWIV